MSRVSSRNDGSEGLRGWERVSLMGGPSITAFLPVSAARRAAVVMKRLPSSAIR